MNKYTRLSAFWPVLLIVAMVIPAGAAPQAARQSEPGPVSAPVGTRPAVLFVPNRGQWPETVRYQARVGEQTWWFTDEAIWVTVVERPNPLAPFRTDPVSPHEREVGDLRLLFPDRRGAEARSRIVSGEAPGVNLRLTLLGQAPAARWVAGDLQPGRLNYLKGNDPTKWRPNVPTFGRVTWQGVLEGIDLDFDGRVFIARGQAQGLQWQVTGAQRTEVNAAGQVVAQTGVGPVILPELRAAEPKAPTLNIRPAAPADDPTDLLYSTYLGGVDLDYPDAMAVDASGAAYITGLTWSENFPTTPGAFQTSFNGELQDAFVTKLNPGGTGLVYSTYLGGSRDENFDTSATLSYPGEGYYPVSGRADIEIDGAGYAYLTGETRSADFPVTVAGQYCNGIQPLGPECYLNYSDSYVVKYNPSGAILWATFLGGVSDDYGWGITVSPSAQIAYVTGATFSVTGFPTINGWQTWCGSCALSFPWPDAFVTAYTSVGAISWSSYLGGTDRDEGHGVSVWSTYLYVTGQTSSSDFFPDPTPQPPGFQQSNAGGIDAFATKIQP